MAIRIVSHLSEMAAFAELMGAVWSDAIQSGPWHIDAHPAMFVTRQHAWAWDAWRAQFDRALQHLLPRLTVSSDMRDRRKILRAKLEHQFWSTVPEVTWGG